MRTGLTQQEKTTEIYFDEKDPTIFIRIPQHRPQEHVDRLCRNSPRRVPVRPGHGCKGI